MKEKDYENGHTNAKTASTDLYPARFGLRAAVAVVSVADCAFTPVQGGLKLA